MKPGKATQWLSVFFFYFCLQRGKVILFGSVICHGFTLLDRMPLCRHLSAKNHMDRLCHAPHRVDAQAEKYFPLTIHTTGLGADKAVPFS